MRRKSIIVDSLEEQAVLARLRQTSLAKVKSITDEGLKQAILEALSRPGAFQENPVALANEIIKNERKRLTEQTGDRKKLKEQIQELYSSQAWKIERIARTESANAVWTSQLIGYREQGIERFTFHSHTEAQKTCPICLALNGTIHSVEEWLDDGGRYPLSSHTHPGCRCFSSPVISHVTLQETEDLFSERPDLFAPGKTVFDKYHLELEDVVKEYQKLYGTEIEDMPVEHEQGVKDALSVIKETPYQELQPTQLRFVKDVGDTDEFKEHVTPEPVLGQVTAWTTPDNEMLVSTFAAHGGNTIESTVIREWAGRVYDDNKSLQKKSQELYDRDEVGPDDLSPKTIEKLLKTFDPFTMMRVQLISGKEAIALEKRLRDAPEKKLPGILDSLGILAHDVDIIVKWRDQRPVWERDTGKLIPSEGLRTNHNRFINRVAEQGSREMFQESAVSFVADPWSLYGRDPDLFMFLKDEVFGGQDFRKS